MVVIVGVDTKDNLIFIKLTPLLNTKGLENNSLGWTLKRAREFNKEGMAKGNPDMFTTTTFSPDLSEEERLVFVCEPHFVLI